MINIEVHEYGQPNGSSARKRAIGVAEKLCRQNIPPSRRQPPAPLLPLTLGPAIPTPPVTHISSHCSVSRGFCGPRPSATAHSGDTSYADHRQ